MNYCIRNVDEMIANLGGYMFDVAMEMEAWCRRHCRQPFVVSGCDEVKFTDRREAETFASHWFRPGSWSIVPMGPRCSASRCRISARACA